MSIACLSIDGKLLPNNRHIVLAIKVLGDNECFVCDLQLRQACRSEDHFIPKDSVRFWPRSFCSHKTTGKNGKNSSFWKVSTAFPNE